MKEVRSKGLHLAAKRIRSVLPAIILLLPARALPEPTAHSLSPRVYAETALTRMRQGNYPAAARQVRMALEADPEDSGLFALAGALLLNTGEASRAQTAFANALACDSADSLALYGLGLAQLAQGNRQAAWDDLDRSTHAGGDRSYLLAARRYTQWLDGAQVAMDSAGLPDILTPAQHALEGMAALRKGDTAHAESELEAALSALPGDAIREPSGVLMSFGTAHPLTAAAGSVGVEGLATVSPGQKGLHGVVQFTPEATEASVAYVSYELDGQSLTLNNVRPFSYDWDTTHATNGWHQLNIVLYDAQGTEIRRATRRVLVANNGAAAATALSPAARVTLWQLLALRPDRFACAKALGQIHQARHDLDGARLWFERAAAVRPDPEARRLLAACGGLSTPGAALWGGRPDEKVVALTFDDGPSPGITEQLLDVLQQQRVPATFFVIGRHVLEYPDLTRKIASAGMEIANHSFTHPNLTRLSAEGVAQEVMQTQAAVHLVTGETPRYLRPPGGDWNAQVASVVREWGLTPCMWTVDAYGSEVIGAQQVADTVLQQVQPGSIILMHNGKLSTLLALPTIIRELRARGYSFATVSALSQRLDLAREEARRTVRSNENRLPHTE